ncbi:MAG: poly-gamma-glutamate hydrolase family protein [Anaerolineales bacterium]|nr:poly-gamma-glutamate hydrolase family protein [Anaerolineales bacterium]
MMDHYRSFAELAQAEREGLDYRRIVAPRASDIAILAPHGGGIEAGTSEIARALAGETLSLYCFEGLEQRGNQRLHLTSTNFDEPLCLALVQQAQCVVAIHGCEGKRPLVHVGGLHGELCASLLASLGAAGFAAQQDNSHHAGNHPENICNRGLSGRGAQLEISEGLRQSLFAGLKHYERENPTPLFWRFVQALRDATG